MAETLSSEARKHVTRGRPRKSAPDQVTAEISDTPPVCSPPAPPPVQVHWNELGKTFGKLAAPFYDALGAAQPDPVLWEGFGLAWGQVVEYYVPTSSMSLRAVFERLALHRAATAAPGSRGPGAFPQALWPQ